jgi:hypothetical protein
MNPPDDHVPEEEKLTEFAVVSFTLVSTGIEH